MSRLSLEQQIAHFEIQRNELVKKIMVEKKASIKKKMDVTALFFKDIIESLNELKARREKDKNIEISLMQLYNLAKQDITLEEFLDRAETELKKEAEPEKEITT